MRAIPLILIAGLCLPLMSAEPLTRTHELAHEPASASAQELAPTPRNLSISDTCPADLAGLWQRLPSLDPVTVNADESLQDLAIGPYRHGVQRITVRQDDSLPAWADAIVGVPTEHREQGPDRRADAESLAVLDPFTVPIWIWRQVDNLEWPWVGHGLTGGGLLGLCDERVPLSAQPSLHPVLKTYAVGTDPITFIAGGDAEIGDLIVAKPAHAVLVADRGILGLLDSADEVVIGLPGAAPTVVRITMHDLVANGHFSVWRRNPERLLRNTDGPHQRANHYQKKIDELQKLPLKQQWMAAGGMALICITLLRLLWKHKRSK